MASECETIRTGNQALFDLTAEEFICGCLLIDPTKTAAAVYQIANRSDFSDPNLAELFDVLCLVAITGKTNLYDFGALWEMLKREKNTISRDTLTRAFIAAGKLPHASNAIYYADRIARLSKLRRLALAIGSAAAAINSDADPNEIAGRLESLGLSMQQSDTEAAAKILTDCWDETILTLGKMLTEKTAPAIMSGLVAADNAGFVFVPGELTILAARPGCGKTTLAVQILKHHAARNRPTFFASLEMSKDEVSMRTLMGDAGIDYHFVRSKGVNQQMLDAAIATRHDSGTIPLTVWSPKRRASVGQIYAAARLAQQKSGLSLIAVDYIGLVNADDKRLEFRHQIGEICRGLREIGQQLEVPVIALCQLSRGAESETPRLKHLADSGDIEKHADIVAMLHRTNNRDNPGETQLIIEKCRHGPGGTILLQHDGKASLFSDPSQWGY